MATASIPGFKARLYIATSVGATLNKIGELAEVTLTIAQGAMDATSKDSLGWRENIAGLREWSITGSGMYLLESTDAGQSTLFSEINVNSNVYIQLYELSTATGNVMWTGNAVPTGFDIGSPLDKPADAKYTFKGTAALTKTVAT